MILSSPTWTCIESPERLIKTDSWALAHPNSMGLKGTSMTCIFNGLLGNANGEDDIEYYKSLLIYFKEEVYLTENTKQVVDRMEEVSKQIFDTYWKKDSVKTTTNKYKKKKRA